MSLYLAAALLPLLPGLASVATAIGGGAWSGVTGSLVRAATPGALLYSAACIVVAAPLAGVAVAARRQQGAPGRRREPALAPPKAGQSNTAPSEAEPACSSVRGAASLDAARRLAIATLVFSAVSAALTAARLGLDADTLRFVATSHAVLASATLALAALGAVCGTLFRDPLDAAGVALTVSLAAAYGVLVGGASVGELSPSLLTAAVLASPVMTVATAAHVDLVRSDIWYQISPLAHIRLEYPAWGAVCGSYLLAGCAGFFAASWYRAGRRPEQEFEGL